MRKILIKLEKSQMNKSVLVAAIWLVLTLPFNVLAGTEEEIQAQCRQYATDDSVPAQELDEYMAQCVQDLLAEAKSMN